MASGETRGLLGSVELWLTGLGQLPATNLATIASGNTNSPTTMISEQGAAMVMEDAETVAMMRVARHSASPF